MKTNITMPSSPAIERSVIGAFFISNKMWLKYGFMVRPEYFHNSALRQIMTYMLKINSTDKKLVFEQYPAHKDEILSIIENYSSSGNFTEEINILRDKYSRRLLIETAYKSIESAQSDYEKTASQHIDELITEINTEHIVDGKPEHIKDLMGSVMNRLQAGVSGESFGYETGLKDVDKILGGFVKKEMTILAARPSMGKTSFILSIIRHLAINKNTPVLFFSLEMGREAIAARILFSESKASYGSALLGNKNELSKIASNIDKINKAGIYIDDTPGMTVSHLQTKAENYVNNFGVKIIFIDHRGFIKPAQRGRSTNDEVSEISKGICNVAKKLDIPIVLVSQLSREVERRSPPVPMLSDLRDSGTLEEDARKVVMLYREDYYKPEACMTPGVTQILIAKNHNGSTGVRNVFFEKDTMNFYDIAKDESDGDDKRW